jgi:hypothetical protein
MGPGIVSIYTHAMDVYEFILIPSSIIIGLGIAELFRGVVRILRGELKAGSLHLLWITLVFGYQVQWFWASWEMSTHGTWLFPEFIIFIIGPIGLYMAAAMLFPATDSDESLDVHFLAGRKPFFVILILILVSFSLSGWFVVKDPLGYQDLSRLIAIVLYGVLAVTKHRGVHLVSVFFFLGSLLLFTYFFTLRVG